MRQSKLENIIADAQNIARKQIKPNQELTQHWGPSWDIYNPNFVEGVVTSAGLLWDDVKYTDKNLPNPAALADLFFRRITYTEKKAFPFV